MYHFEEIRTSYITLCERPNFESVGCIVREMANFVCLNIGGVR